MLFWLLLTSTMMGWQPAKTAAPARALSVQKLILPEEKLPDFFPQNEITLFKDEAEFDRLLERYNSRLTTVAGRVPTSCVLEASFDPITGRLVGKGVWSIPAGDSHKAKLSPWNLRIDAWQGAEPQGLWGLDSFGDLSAAIAHGKSVELKVEWNLSAAPHQGRYAAELRVPNCASARLKLTLPPGWSLRTAARTTPVEAGGATEIYFGGSAGLSLELIPPTGARERRGVVTWQSDQRFRFDEAGVEWRGEVRIEALQEPIERLNLLIDERCVPQELKATIPARWSSRESTDGRVLWCAEFRRPVLGPFRIELKGTLSAPAPGTPWRPPRVAVEDGLARGENLTFSIPRTLSIQSLDDGVYERSSVSTSADGRLELVFSGVGGLPSSSVAPALQRGDVLDWPALGAALERDANEEQPSVGKRLWTLLDQQQRSRWSTGARAGKLNEGDKTALIDALNRILARTDFMDGERSGGSAASKTATLEQNRRLLETQYRNLILGGATSRGLPSVRLQPDHSVVETTHQVFFDLRRGRARLAAKIQWKGLEGSLDRPSVWMPPGWTTSAVETESSVDASQPRLLSHRVEPNDERGDILWMQWDKPLVAGKQFKATIFAEPQDEPTFHLTETIELPLPEIRPFDPSPSGTSVYCLFLDPGLRCGKENLPPPQPGSMEFPWPKKPLDVEEYSFQYVAPLQRASLRVFAEQPRYSVESSNSIFWNDDHWTVRQIFDVSVEQGLAQGLVFSSTSPIPDGVRWRVEGAGESWASPTPVAPPAENRSKRGTYRLEFPAPVDRKARLLADWTVAQPELEIPLLEFPAAERYRSTIEIASPRGRPIAVESEGLPETDPGRESARVATTGLIWSTAYARLPDVARVKLKVAPGDPDSGLSFQGSARLICQTVVERSRLVQRILASLDCRRTGPLTLRLPSDRKLWSLLLDGEQVLPRVHGDDSIELDLVAGGAHTLELTYSQPAGSWLGLPMAKLLPPLVGFQISSTVWEVVRYGESAPLGHSQAKMFQFRSIAGEAAGSYSNSLDEAGVLQTAFTQLTEMEVDDLLQGIVSLGKHLPTEYTLLIDQRSLGPGERTPSRSPGNRPLAVDDWLSRFGLTAQTRGKVVVVSDRKIQTGDARRGSLDAAAWAVQAAHKVRIDGEDSSGRFVTPATLASNASEESVGATRSDWRQPGLDVLESFILEAAQPNSPEVMQLVLAPVAPVKRWSRLLALATAFISGWLCKKWDDRKFQHSLTGILTFLAVVYAVGGLPQAVLGISLWSSALVVGGFWLYRSFPLKHGSLTATAAAAVLLAGAQAKAQSIEAPPPKIFRVLVPYNPDPPQRRPSQVIATQSLLELLNAPPPPVSSPILIRSLDLDGSVESPDLVRWKSRLELTVDADETLPLRASLAFSRIKPEKVKMNGKAIDFLPPDESKGLAFSVAQGGSLNLEVEFFTNQAGISPERTIEFGVPNAARTSVRLRVGDPQVRLADGNRPSTWNIERQGDQTILSAESGPTPKIQLHWKTGVPLAPVATKTNVSSAVLVDASPRTQDVFFFFRYEAPEKNIEQLSLLAPSEIIVRRVEAPGLTGWTLENRPSTSDAPSDASHADRILILTFDPPMAATSLVQIHGLVRNVDPERIKLRSIVPQGVQEESSVVGVRLPAGWSAERSPDDADFEIEEADGFVAAWRKIDPTPPGALALTLRARKRPGRLDLTLRRPTPQWSVDQNCSLTPNPLSQVAELAAIAKIPIIQGDLRQLRVRLPEHWELTRASAPGLSRWFINDSVATLLFDHSVHAPTEIRLTGRLSPASPPKNWRDPIAYLVGAPQWLGAGQTQTRWSVASPIGWRVQVDDRQGVSVAELESTTVVVASNDAQHSFRLTLQPIPPDVDVRSLVVVTVQGDQVVYDGRFDMLLSQGVSSRLEFRTPGRSENVVWRSPSLRPPSSVVRGQNRIWSLEPARPATGGRIQLDWRISQKIDRAGRIPVPKVSPVGIPVRETWIVLDNRSGIDATPAERRALSQATPPLDPSAWPEGIVPISAEQGGGFHGESDDWQLVFQLQRDQPASAPFKVRFADLELLESQDGWIRAAIRWEILDQSADLLHVELPPEAQIDDLLVDSLPIPRPERTAAGVTFPLFRKSNWQDVVIYWSMPATPARIPLPRLATDQQFPMLARIRTPSGRSWTPHAPSATRAEWLIRRLERTIDGLADRLREWESRPGPQLEDRIAANLSRTTALEIQAEEAVRSLEQPASAFSEGDEPAQALDGQRRRREQLLAQYQAEPLARRAAETPGDAEDFAPSLSRANADRVEYYNADAPLSDLIAGTRRDWISAGVFSPERFIALTTCGFVLMLLWIPWKDSSLGRYWPALVLALGTAWLRWGSPAGVGLVFVAGAFLGAWWMIQEWFATASNVQGESP